MKRGSFWFAVFFLALGLFGIIESLTFTYWESITLPMAVKESDTKAENRRLWPVFGWVAGLCLAIYLLGFYISIPVFAFAYLKWRKRSWLAAVIFAVALLAASYAIFAIGLKVPLYKGLIFGAR
jgi:hypothetical protein